MLKYKLKWFSLIAVLVVGLSSTTVFALPSQANGGNTLTPSVTTNSHSQSSSNGPNNSSNSSNGPNNSSNSMNGSSHATQGQLKACLNRQNAIQTIIVRIDTRLQNQLGLFTTIAGRVENFYSKSGKTVSNYSQLLSNVNSTYMTAKNTFSSLQVSTPFSCSASHPHRIVINFISDLKTTITNVKAYKTAVKNLIVGVAQANNVSLTTKQS